MTAHYCDYVFAGKCKGDRPGFYGEWWYSVMVCRYCLKAKKVFFEEAGNA